MSLRSSMEAINSIFEVKDAAKPHDFCVHVRIIEGSQFAGINADPVRVCVQIGRNKKYTQEIGNTICPVYKEDFRFNFNDKPAAEFLDEMITLTVLHVKTQMLRMKKTETTIGVYKVNLRTVYDEPDHQFIDKICQLRDPHHIGGSCKGTVKCDFRITCQGSNAITPPIPTVITTEYDEVEGVSPRSDAGSEREKQKVRLIVKIYRADGLPKMTRSVGTYVKENFAGESKKDFVNPYVEVSFAGLEGKTKVIPHNCAPVWNEQIVFHEMFSSLFQRIKIQLKERDNDIVHSNIIGTHFIDLKIISHAGNGGLPTFGPAFIHLYSSTREFGEGVGYRGRLLVEIETNILEDFDDAPTEVQTSRTCPISAESDHGIALKSEEFFLFGSIMNATMMEVKSRDKVFLEISIGNAGNTLDGDKYSQNHDHVHEIDYQRRSYDYSNSEACKNIAAWTKTADWSSTTPPMNPMTYKSHNNESYFLPYRDEKPCMYIKSHWPDNRLRMYNSNMIMKLAETLEEGLTNVSHKMEKNELKQVLENFTTHCIKYISKAELRSTDDMSIKLDRDRMEMCLNEIKSIREKVEKLRAGVTKQSLKHACNEAKGYLMKLKSMIEDPQDALPDIFLWLIVNNKRHAYQRIAAKDLIFSVTEEERGKFCSKVHTLFLMLPGNKRTDPCSRWIQAKIDIYLWFGLFEEREHFLEGYPTGYEKPNEVENIENPNFLPPLMIHCTEKHTFKFQAHMYEARSLIGSDDSGFSDPFARVFIGECSNTTEIRRQTVTPIWNEMLIIDDITLYGSKEYIKKEPPLIVIEIFDKDPWSKSDYLGLTTARPHVQLVNETVCPTSLKLEWHNIQRCGKPAGELLATFELIQNELPVGHYPRSRCRNDQPRMRSVSPIPHTIAPKKAMYRIEVFFGGLRNLKKGLWATVKRPIVEIECAGKTLSSDLQAAVIKPNFLDLELPEENVYKSPLTIRVLNQRSFGKPELIGSHVINSVHKYIHDPVIKCGKNDHIGVDKHLETLNLTKKVIIKLDHDLTVENKTRRNSIDCDDAGGSSWWTRYFASMGSDVPQDEREAENQRIKNKKIVKFTIYPNELEAQPEFHRFQDWLSSFDLYSGKVFEQDFNDTNRLTGTFKGSFKVYKCPLPEDTVSHVDLVPESHRGVSFNNPTRVMIHIYIAKAQNLHPINENGYLDPYICIQLGSQRQESKYIPKELNPVFGECFKIEAEFPRDSLLTIQVLDRKFIFPNNVIGETKIDLENRFHSRHRAICGLSKKYETTGCNKWRDTMKPTEILQELCKNSKLDSPSYKKSSVKIGSTQFKIQNKAIKGDNEQMALAVLHHWDQMEPPVGWALVPEHVELRPLYKSGKKSMERGKLIMWVDIFPLDSSAHLSIPVPRDISPRKFKSYELRVIIWNTSNVKLDDKAFLTGEKMSDIYVKGWVIGPEEDGQCTDVHYRSLTGEGNFNWRFIFPFDYFACGKKIVTTKKSGTFFADERECKIPARLQLQLFDDDLISADDCLGFLVLDLHRFPEGARSAKLCTLDMLKDNRSVTMINIFKKKRVKGWWPFHIKKENGDMELTGKVEAELHLLTKEEAEKKPAGCGRNEPSPLEKPLRPDSSFLWFFNFYKTTRYIIWHNYKWTLFKIALFILFIEFIFAMLSQLPSYLVSKLLDKC